MSIGMNKAWVLAVRSAKKGTWHAGESRPRDAKGRELGEPGCICMSRGMYTGDTICPRHSIQIRKAKIPTRLGSKKFKTHGA